MAIFYQVLAIRLKLLYLSLFEFIYKASFDGKSSRFGEEF